MNCVLVTGAAGFIGRHVSRVFASKGYLVYGIGRGEFSDYRDWGLSEWKESDVCIESLIEITENPEIIVHCAGGSAVGYSIDHPREDFCLTVDTTSHVLEFIRQHSPATRLVYLSTAAVYGQVVQVPIVENVHLNPVSPYGVHKLMAENLCRLYAERYGLKISIVRLFSIYGSGLRKQLLWDACQKYSSGESSFFGTGEEIRDWLHVSDAANLLFLAESHASTNCPVVNGGYGKGIKVRDILEKLVLELQLDVQPSFSSCEKVGDPDILVADIDSAKAWGWLPQKKLSSGLAEYVNWFLRGR